eukprot:TRINITY_DN2560_c0_g1_i1.p1 TRINITY_DN2560_c0_g1~~TRINITY_DN2560_c0_g1_i1.p1  ORF type:complete len:1039 (-),score=203.29 TRINITY_DN2560_c0_g1_i1:40-2991(-)
MSKSHVFISGIGGLGVEIAKNVVLAGVHRVTLHDTKTASIIDLATQYYVTEKDIGQNRAEVSAPRVRELNPYVNVDFSTHSLDGDLSFLSQYQCVVLTETPLSIRIKVNDYCHSRNICFITADTFGVFCQAFCDFGNNFEIHDKNGEDIPDVFLSNVSREDDKTVVTTLEHHMHGLEDGDVVKLTEIEGLKELNYDEKRNNVYKITVISPYKFSIPEDISSYGKYISGGLMTHVKEVIVENYLPLKEALEKPIILMSDLGKFDYPNQLHIGFQALENYREKHGSYPEPWNISQANEVVTLANEINQQTAAKVEKLDEKLIKLLAATNRGQIIGMTAFLGGSIGQEVLKACSGKFTPLKQWFYLDAIELLPDIDGTDFSDFIPSKPETRYDGQIICIGKTLNNKLRDAKLFMIGAGAIGCEMLKNYALLGIGTGKHGQVIVTDNDLIETSNLSRQFLFREKDVQSAKSETSAKSVKAMNPDINIDARLDKIGPETEDKYPDKFFGQLDVVVNALDNVQARLYVDSRCVTNQKPLLESGTMGTKAHVQVILPHKTETYASSRDPPEKDVPFCTIKSFPSRIEHTIQWARDKFESLFVTQPREVQQFLEDKSYLQGLKSGSGRPRISMIRHIKKIATHPPTTWEDCITFARIKFQSYFHNAAQQIIHAFPLDMKMKDGTKFWALPKRPPTPLVFDPKNSSHMSFIIAAAGVYARVHNIKPNLDIDTIAKICSGVKVPEFKPKSKHIETDESKTKEEVVKQHNQEPEQEFESLLADLEKLLQKKPNLKLSVEEFEKDDDENFHVDFITAASNLRASSYSISPSDKLKTKQIAGKIIPAIATTTSAVAGLVSIELVKVLNKDLPLEKFKNTFLNLALPLFALSEPAPAQKTLITGTTGFTVWDRWEVKGDLTLQEFIDHFKKVYNLTVTGVFQEVKMVYVAIMPMHKKRLPQKMSALVKGDEYVDLIVSFDSEKGDNVNGPIVRYWFK